METIHPEDRKHLVLVTPTAKTLPSGERVYDPHDEACKIATFDWKAKYPDVGTLILDGGTELCDQLLRSYANQGVFSGASGDKHLMVGQKGTPGYMAQPLPGDYSMAQNGMNHIFNYLFRQPLSIIVVFQAGIYQPDGQAAASAAVGGPMGAGGKSVNRITSKFNTVVRMDGRSVSMPDPSGKLVTKISYKAYTEQRGIWQAKLRKPVGVANPLAELDITDRPHVFWEEFERVASHWAD